MTAKLQLEKSYPVFSFQANYEDTVSADISAKDEAMARERIASFFPRGTKYNLVSVEKIADNYTEYLEKRANMLEGQVPASTALN